MSTEQGDNPESTETGDQGIEEGGYEDGEGDVGSGSEGGDSSDGGDSSEDSSSSGGEGGQ